MAIFRLEAQIPEDAENTRQRFEFEGVQFEIVTKWAESAGGWYADLFDADGNAIVEGVRVVTGIRLFVPYGYAQGAPAGSVFVSWNADGQAQDPTRDSFKNGDASLWYEEGAGA